MTISNGLINKLKSYPFLNYCFEEYLRYVLSSINNESNLMRYDLIFYLHESMFGDGDAEKKLQLLEDRFNASKDILKLSGAAFKSRFNFSNGLLTDDPDKFHDIIAEPLFVLDLNNNGFNDIEKLPMFIKCNGMTKKNADFKAEHHGVFYAIEMKTIRTESWAEEGKLLGDSKKAAWWKEMVFNNCKTKIEDKNGKLFEQLKNACDYYNCDKKIAFFYTRRLGPSTLMGDGDYVEVLKRLHKEYSEIDHYGSKNYFADVVVFYPSLVN
ncbi:MAG: hypothetical protein JW873_03815 [Candidatus Saganbacteria bacterium]|nr:hypothetical protein [Candidatus Saganbacteria bacterium]